MTYSNLLLNDLVHFFDTVFLVLAILDAAMKWYVLIADEYSQCNRPLECCATKSLALEGNIGLSLSM